MAPVARYFTVVAAASLLAAAGIGARAGHDFEEPVDYASQEHVKKLIDIGEDITFIDMRSAQDFAKSRLPTAKSIPIDVLGHRWQEIPTSGRVVLYCACPPGEKDEIYAFTLMRQEKYRNITVLEGGFNAWVKRGYPVEAVSR